jgi:hypothetical protein
MPQRRKVWSLEEEEEWVYRKRPGIIHLSRKQKEKFDAETEQMAMEWERAQLLARKRQRREYDDNDDNTPYNDPWHYSPDPDDSGGYPEIHDETDYDVVSREPGWIDEGDWEEEDNDDDDFELRDTMDALASLTIHKDGSPSDKEMADLHKRVEDIQQKEARKASRMASRAILLTNWQKFVSVATGDMAFNTFADERQPCMKCGSTDIRSIPVVSLTGDCRLVC